jgi:N-acetyl-beta-hexosaminidase
MDSAKANPGSWLLPQPRECSIQPSACRLDVDSPIEIRTAEPRVERAVVRWRAGAWPGSGPPSGSVRPSGTRLVVGLEPNTVEHPDGYRLTVRSDGIELLGQSPAGCFHGLQTLDQLAACPTGPASAPRLPIANRQSTIDNPRVFPCCTIVDWPDFETRGLLFDVTRGRVPTVETLERLVDRLVFLKVNQLQLNIEHAFVFPFDPDICGPDDGLTPDEIRRLDA